MCKYSTAVTAQTNGSNSYDKYWKLKVIRFLSFCQIGTNKKETKRTLKYNFCLII